MEEYVQRVKKNIVLKVTIDLQHVSPNIEDAVYRTLVQCYEHRCYSGAILINLDRATLNLLPDAQCVKDYLEIKASINCDFVTISGQPTVEMTVLDFKEGYMMASSEFIKCYLALEDITNYERLAKPGDEIVLVSRNKPDIRVGVKILCKILKIDHPFKESTFIAENAEFMGVVESSNNKPLRSKPTI